MDYCGHEDLEIITALCSQWHFAKVHLDDEDVSSTTSSVHSEWTKTLKNLRLDALTSLSIYVKDKDAWPVFQSWTTPSLKHLECSQISLLAKLKFIVPLESLKVELEYSKFPVKLLSFLTTVAAASLVQLSVTFKAQETDDDEVVYAVLDRLFLPRIEMRNLRALCIDVRPDSMDYFNNVERLMGRIEMPQLTTFRLSAHAKTVLCYEMESWLRQIQNKAYYSLKEVSVKVHSGPETTQRRKIEIRLQQHLRKTTKVDVQFVEEDRQYSISCLEDLLFGRDC